MPNNLRVFKSRVRGPDTANHKAERDAKVEEMMTRVSHYRREAERLMAKAELKQHTIKPRP